MGISFLIIIGFTALASNLVVESISIPSRRFASCGYMSSKIYCYGGQTSVVQTFSTDNTLYSLEITQLSGQTTEYIDNNWEIVVPQEPFDTELRRLSNAIVLADGKRLLVHGGFGDEHKRFSNQTIIYDSTTNTWQSTAPYTEGAHGIRQIYSAAVVNLPTGDVGFYGGSEQLANTAVPQVTSSGKNIDYWSDDNGTFVGFTSLQLYSPNSSSWKSFNPQNNVPGGYYYQAQTATLDTGSGKVYFLGGIYYTLIEEEVKVTFNWAHTFNTNSGSWLNETLSGETSSSYGIAVPTPRQFHTANLLPNSRDIILYGGTGGNDTEGKPSIDYCYTLNLESNKWTDQTSKLQFPPNMNGFRVSHSSVIVDTTLFIIFGNGGTDGNILQNTMMAINVADVKNISYSATFGAPSDSMTLPNNNNAQSSSQNQGMIGGIVGGVVAALLAIAAAAVCVVRRRRKLQKLRDQEKQEENEVEEIHVDWNTIDDQYREVSPVSWSIPNTPHTENLTASSKRESFSQRFSSTLYSTDTSVVKPSIGTETSYSVIKPDAVQD